MFLIFGFRTKGFPQGWVAMVCQVCGQAGNLFLIREVTKFSLFFIPLFPVRTRYVAECQNPMCRTRHKVSGSEARRLLDAGVRPTY
ncbi:zinc-ribbon domain-containing protein [Micromonosporaceae bacterium Da 78-11]